ncbi:hypothetical protein LSTR_LSTR015719 [Laodelphax striatellus]|uniref:SAC domain-containing protein n=1 Tax=Laodelphax striatellus TaxID=195883 RepID=A0A482WLF1_LAOST|nr:hypothetical protein LSTR_LSTR015719 [Laodelphax striatellus]
MASKQFLPYEMELFRTDSYYVLLNSTSSLWCNRKTGAIEVKPGWELANAGDPECMGVFYGVVGRLDFDGCASGAGAAARLVLIKSTAPVGQLPSPAAGTVHKICAVAVLHIQGAADELNLRPCKKHRRSTGADLLMTSQLRDGGGGGGGSGGGGQLAKTWGSIKSATSTIKNTTQHAAALATSQVKGGSGSAAAKSSTTERRILDEVQRIFADTDSFYFSVVSAAGQPGDLTNSMQRHCEGAQKRGGAGPLPVWHTVDERFFWNKHMLRDIIQLNVSKLGIVYRMTALIRFV